MERAGRLLSQASTALEAQVTKHKAQEESAELRHVMNFVLTIARSAPLAPQQETDRLATASEAFSAALERASFVAGDLKKAFGSVHLLAPLFNATIRLAAAAAPLATAPGSHPDRHAISTLQTQLILDSRVVYWWQQMAGAYALHVNWDTFVHAFSRACEPPQPLSGTDIAIMKYMLDPYESGYIASWRYGELARALGTPNNILHRLRELAGLRAFIGYASSTEADRLLGCEASGTLLVRVSKGRPSTWALAAKDTWGRISHSNIVPTPQGALLCGDKSYNTFVALITEIRFAQGQPMLIREPSFYGELVSTRADDMLQGKSVGSYLWRYSSRPGMLALSFINKQGGYAQHITVEQTAANSFKLEEHTHVYTNLSEVIMALSSQYNLTSPQLHPIWYLPEAASYDSLSASNGSKFGGASPGRGPIKNVFIAGTRNSSSTDLQIPLKPNVRGPSPAPSAVDAAPIVEVKTRPSTVSNTAVPLLASRQGHPKGSSEYDPMPTLGGSQDKVKPFVASPPMGESVVFEGLSRHPVIPMLSIIDSDEAFLKAPPPTLDSPSANPRPRQNGKRADGEYGFMLGRTDSGTPTSSNTALASPVQSPQLKSPGRGVVKQQVWAPNSDKETYDVMPLQP